MGIISCYHLVIYVLSSHGYGQRRITMFQCSKLFETYGYALFIGFYLNIYIVKKNLEHWNKLIIPSSKPT